MVREIINHRWECPDCENTVGEDYTSCPICIHIISIKDTDYSKLVKDVCVSCEEIFNNSYLNYQKSGNYCLNCLRRINDNIKNPSEAMKEFRKKIHRIFNVRTE